MVAVGLLLGFVLALMWLVMAAPLGRRTITRKFVVHGSIDKVRNALHPFGKNFDWNESVSAVTSFSGNAGKMVTTHTDRSGGFIEREFELEYTDGRSENSWRTRFTSDTSLAQNFWAEHEMTTSLRALADDRTEVRISETDIYRGMGFYIFRFFSMRRSEKKLQIWMRDGTFKRGGTFEKPSTQLGMALLSSLLLWPVFGLTRDGLLMSLILTVIVGLHELGHVIAFRMMGHKKSRMIFIPILGGIAMGGRPYDKHFEIGFSALMGAGFSAFLMAMTMWIYFWFEGFAAPVLTHYFLIFALIGALFNLGNLIPVWKFDGGQVLRQVFRSRIGLGIGAFVLLGWFAVIGFALGVSTNAMLLIGAVFAMLSLMTTKSGIKPKNPLTPMTSLERVVILAAFAAVFSIHGTVLIWSAERLFA